MYIYVTWKCTVAITTTMSVFQSANFACGHDREDPVVKGGRGVPRVGPGRCRGASTAT